MAGKGRKVVIGCAIGCGSLLLLCVGSCIGFTVWIERRGDLLDPRRLFDAGTTGYVEWTLTAEDPAARAFVTHLFDRSQSKQEAMKRFPGLLQRWISRGQARNREKVTEILPIVVLWTAREGEPGGDDRHLLSLSAEQLGNRMTFLDWTLGLTFRFAPDQQSVNHGKERIYVIGGEEAGFAFFIHDQDLFVTTDTDAARHALDRLTGPAVEAIPSELGDVFASLPDTRLRGAISNANGTVAGIWDVLSGARPTFLERAGRDDDDGETPAAARDDAGPRPDWTPIRLVTLSGGLTGTSSFEGRLELLCADADWAAANGERFVEELRADYRRTHLPFETEVAVVGDRIRIELRLDDVLAFLDEL